ncbi:MAG: purine-binding chemotaxis protein CheW [bacterium]|nr:purine-binding chemotaxis protein CheW [bacterium]
MTAETTTSTAQKFLTFMLHTEEFAVDIHKVREIIAFHDISPLPNVPSHVVGVINLRGTIIPIVDLAAKLGLEAFQLTDETCIVVLEVFVDSSEEVALIGCIVHQVREVLDILTSAMEPPPRIGAGVDLSYLKGVGKIADGEKIVGLLDIDLALADDGHSTADAPSADCEEGDSNAAGQ